MTELADPPRNSNLRVRAARGTMIAAGFSVGLQALGFLKGFAVAAFLTKSEYGIWGILVITLGTLSWLKQVGISEKYVQQTEDDQRLAFQRAFTLDLFSNLILIGLALIVLPVFAAIYGQEDILLPGFLLIAFIPVHSLRAPVWIFYRDMRFGAQRTLDAIDPVVAFIVTIALAVAGMGYWALVIGSMAGTLTAGIAAVAFSPHPLAIRFDRTTAREYFGFSWPLFVASASGLVIPQTSMLVGEATVGLAGAGIITLASTISVYTDKVDQIVTWTLYPAICRVADRTEILFEAFVKSNRLTLMWGVPFGVGIALFADDIVQFGFGEEWNGAIDLIRIFGLVAAINHIGFNWSAFFRARGDTRPLAVYGPTVLLAFLCFPIPLLIAFGLDGFGLGMGIMTLVGLTMRAMYLRRLFSGFKMIRHGLRAMAPTFPAFSVVFFCKVVIPDPSLAVVLGEIALYLAITAFATWVFEGALLREVLRYVRGRTT